MAGSIGNQHFYKATEFAALLRKPTEAHMACYCMVDHAASFKSGGDFQVTVIDGIDRFDITDLVRTLAQRALA